MELSRVKDRVFRYFYYFRRGHSTYFVYLISFLNFIVIQYRLLIERIPFLEYVFQSLTAFALAFFATYIPVAILIGWLDVRRGAVPVEGALLARVNPYSQTLLKALYLMADGRNEEAKALLRPWIERWGADHGPDSGEAGSA